MRCMLLHRVINLSLDVVGILRLYWQFVELTYVGWDGKRQTDPEMGVEDEVGSRPRSWVGRYRPPSCLGVYHRYLESWNVGLIRTKCFYYLIHVMNCWSSWVGMCECSSWKNIVQYMKLPNSSGLDYMGGIKTNFFFGFDNQQPTFLVLIPSQYAGAEHRSIRDFQV